MKKLVVFLVLVCSLASLIACAAPTPPSQVICPILATNGDTANPTLCRFYNATSDASYDKSKFEVSEALLLNPAEIGIYFDGSPSGSAHPVARNIGYNPLPKKNTSVFPSNYRNFFSSGDTNNCNNNNAKAFRDQPAQECAVTFTDFRFTNQNKAPVTGSIDITFSMAVEADSADQIKLLSQFKDYNGLINAFWAAVRGFKLKTSDLTADNANIGPAANATEKRFSDLYGTTDIGKVFKMKSIAVRNLTIGDDTYRKAESDYWIQMDSISRQAKLYEEMQKNEPARKALADAQARSFASSIQIICVDQKISDWQACAKLVWVQKFGAAEVPNFDLVNGVPTPAPAPAGK